MIYYHHNNESNKMNVTYIMDLFANKKRKWKKREKPVNNLHGDQKLLN